jgi:hypothetical protein
MEATMMIIDEVQNVKWKRDRNFEKIQLGHGAMGTWR